MQSGCIEYAGTVKSGETSQPIRRSTTMKIRCNAFFPGEIVEAVLTNAADPTSRGGTTLRLEIVGGAPMQLQPPTAFGAEVIEATTEEWAALASAGYQLKQASSSVPLFAAPVLAARRTSLLGDRVTVHLPDGMVIAPRQASFMAAENASADETRGILDHGTARFVMMAHELYELGGHDLRAAVAADLARSGQRGTLEPLALPGSLVGCALTPASISTDQQANMVYAAWIADSDTAVQFIGFYTNPAGAADPHEAAGWSALGRAIVASLERGTRMLKIAAGERTLGSLVVRTPAGWTVSEQRGPDFVVHRLRKLVPFGAPGIGCSVYVGYHPSLQCTQQGAKVTPTRSPGTIFGAPIEWLTWSARGRWTTETLVKHPTTDQAVHVFCSSLNEPDLGELRQIASTLRHI